MSRKQMAIIYKIWRSNFSKMPTKLSGSGSMTINTQERHCTFQKNGTLRSPQSSIWRSQCCPENIHPPHFFLLLAKNLFRHPSTHQNLSPLSTKKIFHRQATAVASTADARPTQHPHPRHAGCQTSTQIYFVRNRCLHKICTRHSN